MPFSNLKVDAVTVDRLIASLNVAVIGSATGTSVFPSVGAVLVTVGGVVSGGVVSKDHTSSEAIVLPTKFLTPFGPPFIVAV